MQPAQIEDLRERVRQNVEAVRVTDIHTHLYDPAFGGLLLWGIDDLLVYHYLIAEGFRWFDLSYDDFWALSKEQQADLIWNELFIRHSPISEACRGVITTLNALSLDPKKRDLRAIRQWFAGWNVEDYTGHCLELAGVKSLCMTNSPFDETERPVWEQDFRRDRRFQAGLRLDPLLLGWAESGKTLETWGFETQEDLGGKTVSEIRRFLAEWTSRIDPQYLMVSLPPDFRYPDRTIGHRILNEAILEHCREHDLPLALMMGVKRAVNPRLGLAGDGAGRSDLSALASLCERFPQNKFLVTVLARENQQELCVLARKFRNLHVFGCWWFTNVPSIVTEMTRMRLELIGISFTPQHSDARVLDQLIYKWKHSRQVIGGVLADKYAELASAGWLVTDQEVQRDIEALFGGAFRDFKKLSLR
jgi:hypothetical protein